MKNEFRSIVDGSPYTLSEGDDSDKEVYAAVGTPMTLRRLCELMITVSSNFAANLLIDRLGAGRTSAHRRRRWAPTACRCCAASKIRRRSTRG